MEIDFTEDIHSVTDLKRHTRDILAHVHQTGWPVVLTVNGKADAILIDAKTYEKHLKASNLSLLLLPAEQDVMEKRTRLMKSFLKDFRHDYKIPRWDRTIGGLIT